LADYDEDLTNLDEWIRRLKVEYDIFFIGNRRKPPDDLRLRVERGLKRLSEATDMSLPQRFRYNTLIARFYVFRDLWRRTQQEKESASGAQGGPVSPALIRNARSEEKSSEVQIMIADVCVEADKVRRLYDELLRMRGSANDAPKVSFQQFEQYIAHQIRGIRKKCQCAGVTFRIALENKAIKFTAKANNGPSS